jgi:hypothetical protein
MVLSFFDRLYSISARHGEGDRLVWNPSKNGLCEVRSFYEELIRKDGPNFHLFRRRIFGVLRLQLGWLSSYGQQLWTKY